MARRNLKQEQKHRKRNNRLRNQLYDRFVKTPEKAAALKVKHGIPTTLGSDGKARKATRIL